MKYSILVVFLLHSVSVIAQGLFENATIEQKDNTGSLKLDIQGYGRGSAYVGFENYNYTNLFGEAAFQGKMKKNKALIFADIRLRDGFQFDEPLLEFELKEAYAGYSGHKLDALLGNQIVTWGRADGFNPTNCITPTNYFFLSAEPDDQKLSNFMLRFKYRFTSQIELDFISIPVYKPSVYRYELFDMGNSVTFNEMYVPTTTFENSTFAARLNIEIPQIGFSVSWFKGYNPAYSIDVQKISFITGTAKINYVPIPYLKNMLGADFSLPIDSWIIRGEFAYNITNKYKDSISIPNPDLHYVVGIEHNFYGFNTILQYIGRYTFDFIELKKPILTDPTNPQAQMQYANDLIMFETAQFSRKSFHQQKETNHAWVLTIIKPFAYEIWNAELTGYYNLTSEEYIIQPKLSWNISDALTAGAGYSYMAGPKKELFSYAKPVLNGGFLELKVNF